MAERQPRRLNVGFVSTRFRGLDGVSLEAAKWASVLREFGHRCFWFAGQLDREPEASFLVPEAFFDYPAAAELTKALFSSQSRTRRLTEAIHRQKEFLKDRLYEFIERFHIELLIPENALSIPMHIPLGVALTELIAETGIPTIAHHHDFYWERPRYLTNACQDVLAMAFPPDLPSIRHVVINSIAQAELAARRSIAAHVVYNVMDFDRKPPLPKDGRRFRKDMGFGEGDILILQPTRVIFRKGIEQAVYLVEMLGMPNARLIVSHSPADEGTEYAEWVRRWSERQGVPVHFIHNRLNEEAGDGSPGSGPLYSLWDVYPHADLITYPSIYEGFGNAFLEAVYFKKPLLVNRYSVYIVDIEPKGFDVVEIDGYLTERAVAEVRRILQDPCRRQEMVEKNFQLARRFFSYRILRKELANLISGFFGIAPPQGLFQRLFGWD